MNRAFFIGRLAKDVEVRQSQSGKSVGNFVIAVNSGPDNKAHFFRCVAFDKAADNIAKYFSKGEKIALEAEPQQNTWEDSNGTKHYDVNFVVRSWEFVESKKSDADDSWKEEGLPFS